MKSKTSLYAVLAVLGVVVAIVLRLTMGDSNWWLVIMLASVVMALLGIVQVVIFTMQALIGLLHRKPF